MTRRTFLKRILATFITLVGLGGGTYLYAREIEPFLLSIQAETLRSTRLSANFSGYKIVQFSDTHIGFQYGLKELSKLVKKINDQQPDLIVFTGDLIDDPENFKMYDRLTHLLKQLQASTGKYWIYGNHDHGGYGTEVVEDIMKQADFHLLKNNHTAISHEGESFTLAGIDDTILGKPDIKQTTDQVPDDDFTLLLAHEPDYADIAKKHAIDVQLSGHSHGGQVRLPLIGHLYTPLDAKKYVSGKYVIPEGDLTLFVSKGVGTTRMPYRFLCRPEINVYTLQSDK